MAETSYLCNKSGYMYGSAWVLGSSSIIQGSSTYSNYTGMMFFEKDSADAFSSIRSRNAAYFARQIRVILHSHVSYTRTVRLYMGKGISHNSFPSGTRPTAADGTTYVEASCSPNADVTFTVASLAWLQALVDADTTCMYINRGDSDSSYWEGDGSADSGTQPTLLVDWYARPSAPTAFTVSPSIYETESVTLAWSGAGGTIDGYEIQYSTDGGASWLALDDNNGGVIGSTSASGSCATASVNSTRGGSVLFRIRARALQVGSTYIYSSWKTSGSAKKNRLPTAPTIVFPVDGTTTYNPKPRMGFRYNTEPDSQGMKGYVNFAGRSAYSSGTNSADWDRTGDDFASGDKAIVKRGTSLSAGTFTINAQASDGLAFDGNTATRSITMAAPAWTDPDLSAVGAVDDSGKTYTKVRGVWIRELRTKVNTVRAYYGMAAYVFTDTILDGGQTPIRDDHILELRDAINEVAAFITAFDPGTTYDISFTWTDSVLLGAARNPITHIQELRNAVVQL